MIIFIHGQKNWQDFRRSAKGYEVSFHINTVCIYFSANNGQNRILR